MSSSGGNVSADYTWDELNRLSTVVDHRLSGSNTTTYTYDAANNLATATYPNAIGGEPVNWSDPRGRAEEESYAIRLATTVKTTVVLNAIGCGISIGSSLATGTLIEAFGDDRTGAAFMAFGCLTMTVESTGRVQVGLDAIALAGCGWGLYQAYKAENVYFEDLNEKNYEKAEVDLQKVDADLFGSIGGCAITLASMALE